jgi:Cd2+/Zn2+-exporting ATPase
VISGCVECASDLTPLRRVVGVRDVRLLSATGTLLVDAATTLDDKVLLRTATAAGLTLAPELPAAEAEGQRRKKDRWWLRPELICQRIAFFFMLLAELFQTFLHQHTTAVPFALASIGVGIYYPARNAWTVAKAGRFSLNVLLIVAVAGAMILGKFNEASCVVVIFTLGMLLESYVADRARKSIQGLMDLSPQRAERFGVDGTIELVPVEQLSVGDLALVRPGSRLPTDGEVVDGNSWVDTSAITGESMPVEAGPGAAVYGGTLNGQATLRIRVTKPFQDTVLARAIREVEEAEHNRGRAQRFADRFAAVYTPVMIALAAAMAVAGPLLFGLTWQESFYRALVVLIVSCSCSLVLSVPVSVVAAVARAARDGVLVKGGIYLERLAAVRAVAFDKTGTLTRGRPIVTQTYPTGNLGEPELLRLAAAVEAGATHPIADAVVRAARRRGVPVVPAPDIRVIAGLGAEGSVDGRHVVVGRVGDLTGDPAAAEVVAAIETTGSTPVAVTVDGALAGLLGVADELREDAGVAIERLTRLGVTHTTVLTGDRELVAQSIASRLGLENVRSQLMPEDKSAAIRAVREQYGEVAMVGDGINDAPALATADVGVVMGAAGSDVALETADVALMADDLAKLPYAVALARRTRRIIGQNIALSLTAILALVVAAVTGWFTLTWGVLANEAWALLVIGNGLRLLRAKPLAEWGSNTTSPTDVATLQPPVVAGASGPADVAMPQQAPVVVVAGGGCDDGSCGCGADAAAEPAAGPQLLAMPSLPSVHSLASRQLLTLHAAPAGAPTEAEEDCGCTSCGPAAQDAQRDGEIVANTAVRRTLPLADGPAGT